MCYATANPITNTEGNSILELPILKDYLGTINEYPLPFDIDLALYSWGIITNHVGKVKLINGISPEVLTNGNFKEIDKNTFEVLNDVFLHGVYLNKGFTLKIERISPKILRETKTYLNSKIDRPYAIVYFHLDRLFTDQFTTNDLL